MDISDILLRLSVFCNDNEARLMELGEILQDLLSQKGQSGKLEIRSHRSLQAFYKKLREIGMTLKLPSRNRLYKKLLSSPCDRELINKLFAKKGVSV